MSQVEIKLDEVLRGMMSIETHIWNLRVEIAELKKVKQ